MIVPYFVDVPMARVPYANFAIIAATCMIHLALAVSGTEITGEMVAKPGMILGGHLFLHLDWLHLFGNMLFLWVFGNAICAKVGNFWYPVIYLPLGLAAVLVHLLVDGRPAAGASGAINGIVGMFLVWYLLNEVTCFYLFGFAGGTFTISSGWMIALWFVFDIWGAFSGRAAVAYWAHIGGLIAGVALATALLKTGLMTMTRDERSLFDWLAEHRGRAATQRRRRKRRSQEG